MHKDILARIFVYSLFSLLLLVIPHKVFASTLFQDDFTNSSLWTVNSGTWQIVDGKYGAVVSGSQGSRSTANLDITTQNYVLEFDMYSVQGVDRTVRFRTGSNIGEYDLHFTSDGIATNFGVDNHSFILENHPLSDNHFYHFKIELDGQHFIVNIDGNKIFDVTDNNYSFDGSEQLSLVIATGGGTTEVYFDNVKVTTIDDDSKLSVPLFKQTDPQWENNLYDSANVWASPEPSDISRWGCAMTSAAMIFQYHGITKLPDGTDLNPGTLNSWLKSQSDGYIGNGFVNWNALSRLSKQAKPQNPNFAYDTLENKRYAADKTQLALDLQNKIPDILEVPGHFVVATGSDSANTTFFINDPFYDKSTLASYSGNLKSIRSFIPSNSDLSYITFATGKGVSLNLKNSQDYTVGDSYLQDPIEEAGHLGHFNGPVLRMLDYPKPNSGNYTLTVSSPTVQVYDIDGYFYDKNGNVKKIKIKGIVGPSDTDNFTLIFDKNNSSVDTSSQSVTWDSFIQDINSLCKSNDIKIPTCPTIQIQATVAKSLGSGKAVKKAVHELLVTIDKEIVKGKSVSENAFIILHTDIQMLINSL